ncbi:MAG: extracellular solute-binding protein, partial [Planctomycetota bacterium]|nr:extracellular solute-binding protein [Planctomycetota bacterium]
EGLLEKYASPSAADIPAEFKDKDGCWTGYAARGRVIVYNTEKLTAQDAPRSLSSFTDSRWKGQCSIARPLFGTTSTHSLVLFEKLGAEKARELFKSMRANDIIVAQGNATVRDQVARGECLFGWTDTDDVWVGLEASKPIGIVYPDQGADEVGMLLIPNTVALIKGSPNAENGKKLIDFLLSQEVEQMLADGRGRQIPVRKGLRPPKDMLPLESLKILQVDYEKAIGRLDEVNRFLQEDFLR